MSIEFSSIPPEHHQALRSVTIMGRVIGLLAERRSPEDIDLALAALNQTIAVDSQLINALDRDEFSEDEEPVDFIARIARRDTVVRRRKKAYRNRKKLLAVIDYQMSWHAMEVLDSKDWPKP